MTHSSVSKRILNLKPSATLAVDSLIKDLQEKGEKIINLGLGEPDFDTPQSIKNAAIKAIKDGFTHYTKVEGIKSLREAIAKKLLEENKVKYIPEEIVVGVGSKQVLYNAFQVICNPGDEVVLISPLWNTYIEQIKLAGAKPVVSKLSFPFKLVPQDIEKKITRKTKAILLNYPNNPTGMTIERNVLKEIAKLAVNRKIFVISDEIYESLLYSKVHTSIASWGKEIRNLTITIGGFSKTYAMTGWRIGFGAGPRDLISPIISLQGQTTFNTSSISQMAALAAIKSGQNDVQAMLKEYEKRRNFIYKRLSKIEGLDLYLPDGAFYFFIGIKKYLNKNISSSNQWAQKLLQEEKVAVIPGESFLYPDFFRISFTTSLENVKEGLKRIERFVKKYA